MNLPSSTACSANGPGPRARPRERCSWANSELLIAYHDREWGVPQHDDRILFELLILEGAQAGLSWSTILKKRAAYRLAFDDFDPQRVALYDNAKLRLLLSDAGIVRNRLKITSAVANAQAFLQVQANFGSFDRYLWRFVDDKPVADRSAGERPTRSAASDALSRGLRGRGFKFVGTTICYAFMQAVGMVNDHDPACFRRREVAGLPCRLAAKGSES